MKKVNVALVGATGMVGLKRAGAKMIITYHALDVAKWLKEEER